MLEVKYAIFKSPEWYKEYTELKEWVNKGINNPENKTKEPTTKTAGKITARTILNSYRPYHPITPKEAAFINDKNNNLDLYHTIMFREMRDYAFYSIDNIPPEFVLDRNPEPGWVFVSCNYKPNFYFPLDIFQEKLVEIKTDAICDMMKNLGAKTISYGRNISIRKILGMTLSLYNHKSGLENTNTDGENRIVKKSFNRPDEMRISTHPYILDSPFWSKHQIERIEDRVPGLEYTWTIEKTSVFEGNYYGPIEGITAKIGGNYSGHRKETISFVVEYWDM